MKRNYLAERIVWDRSADPTVPFNALHDGKTLSIRLNDFPAEHLYTLIAGRTEVSFDNWPEKWTKSSAAAKAKFAMSSVAKRAVAKNGTTKASAKKAAAGRSRAATAKTRTSDSSRTKSKSVRS
jgi:hypothetical protein